MVAAAVDTPNSPYLLFPVMYSKLKWVREGSVPQATREALADGLTVEMAAMATVTNLLLEFQPMLAAAVVVVAAL